MAATFLFPGQGAQKVGMGADVHQAFDKARERFDEAGSTLGRDISSLCFNGPEEELRATRNTQPALFTFEAALTDVLTGKGVVPSFTAGHSLGEYSALYAAGVFSFQDGLRLVAKRGELMSQVGEKRPGTMAAIIGLTVAQIQSVLDKVDAGIVVPANQNSPQQTVISGEVAAVNAACDMLKEAGAKRAVLLPVSGAFHSPLMQEVADEFSSFLASVSFSVPRCQVVTNVTAQAEGDPDRLKDLLIKQLVSPVRWVESVATLASLDHGQCYEVGPGSVLKGLVRNCDSELSVVSCGTAENVYSVVPAQS